MRPVFCRKKVRYFSILIGETRRTREVKQKMQTPKVRGKLPSVPKVFGKLRAALRSTGAFSAGSEQTESFPAYEATPECRAHQLQVERMKAMAEGYAQRVRRRLV
jgi:hypothetical protein